MALFKKPSDDDAAPSDLDKEVAEAFVAMGRRDKGAPVAAGLARETLISLMFRHADLLSQSGKPQESATLYELATHIAGFDSATLGEGKDIEDLRSLGAILMTAGRFEYAAKIYERIIEAVPDDHDDHIRLASLYYILDRKQQSRDFLLEFFQKHPLTHTASDRDAEPLGKILRFTGYDKTQYKMAPRKDGSFKYYRSGGHFMAQYLLNLSDYDLDTYVVARDNIADQPPAGPHDMILNIIADADTEYNSLKSLEAYLAKTPHPPIVNHPTQVLATTRDNNCDRLNKIAGIRFPRTERFTLAENEATGLANQIEAAGFSYPLIIRQTGTHTAITTELVTNRPALDAYLAGATGNSFYVIEFVENASDAGHYTKMRFFAIDGRLYPVVHHIDEVWNVHGGNRKTFMAQHDWMLEKERRFMDDPASVIGQSAYALLETLPGIIGLDFFGFDFTLLEDGTILIFELNPAMRHSYAHADNFPYLKRHMDAIGDAFTTMVNQKIAHNRR